MARSAEDIAQELKDSIEQSDQTLDTEQGPIPDVMIRPQAGQLALVEEQTDSLRQLFTLQFDEAATDEEVQSGLANYGSAPGAGTPARHIQYFMRFTRPSGDITIPAGTLVSNATGDLVYQTVSQGTILAASAAAYYNPSRGAYEIGLQVQATGTGTAYNLPRFRVNTIVTPVVGIDSTENRVKSTGGLDEESKESQSERLKESLQGINLSSPGGLTKQIKNSLPETVSDVSVVQPFEREFTRVVAGPALDIYVIGTVQEPWSQTIEGTAGQTEIVLEKQPVISVSTFTVNGVANAIGYTLVKDKSSEFGGSLRGEDILVLDTPLLLGDVVYIEYVYNRILEDVNGVVYKDGENYLFNTDILPRSAFVVNPKITGEVQALASYSPTEVEENVTAYLTDYFTFTTFQEIIYPEVVRQDVITKVSGVLSFKLTEFRRATGSLQQIEPMEFARNETSVYSPDFISIRVIK